MNDSALIKTGAIGAVVAAICCATPVLVIALGAVGLSALTGYLDYVLLPILDLKPYFPVFDTAPNARVPEWVDRLMAGR